jgi:hypothetical protein
MGAIVRVQVGVFHGWGVAYNPNLISPSKGGLPIRGVSQLMQVSLPSPPRNRNTHFYKKLFILFYWQSLACR